MCYDFVDFYELLDYSAENADSLCNGKSLFMKNPIRA